MRESTLYKIVKRIEYAVFPRHCAMCGEPVTPDTVFCKHCFGNIKTVDEPVCVRCGRGEAQCACNSRRQFYEQAAAPFYYIGAAKDCIRGLKFKSAEKNADILAEYMTECIKKRYADIPIDIVTCVPISKSSYKKRGYNQSALLAKGVARRLGLRFEDKVLSRPFQSKEQKNLSGSERYAAVLGSFDCIKCDIIANKTVLLCDDILTTGATLNECAKMLLLCGAKQVYCAAAAVTERKD